MLGRKHMLGDYFFLGGATTVGHVYKYLYVDGLSTLWVRYGQAHTLNS